MSCTKYQDGNIFYEGKGTSFTLEYFMQNQSDFSIFNPPSKMCLRWAEGLGHSGSEGDRSLYVVSVQWE